MTRSCCLVFCVLFTLTAVGFAAELTVGESRLLEAVGRECPVVTLWPAGQVPDEPKLLGVETVATSDRDRTGLLLIENVSQPSMTIMAPPATKNTGAAMVFSSGRRSVSVAS